MRKSNISQIYFSYKTTTLQKYNSLSLISLPAITLCIRKRFVITDQYLNRLKKECIHFENDTSEANIDKCLSQITIKEQFKVFLPFEVVFPHCGVTAPKWFESKPEFDYLYGYVRCENISSIRRSIDGER